MTLVLKGTQRVNNLFKSRLIQTLIHPILLSVTLTVCLLTIYRQLGVRMADYLTYENIFGSNSSDFNVLSSDLTIKNNPNNSSILQNLVNEEANFIIETIETNQNNTIYQLSLLKNNTLTQVEEYLSETKFLQTNLTSEFNSNILIISDDYSNLLSNLNSSIMSYLEEQRETIDQYKEELSKAVYVGSSVDIDGLVLNISDIQELLNDAISTNIVDGFKDSTTFNGNIDDVLNELQEIFDFAIQQLKNSDFTEDLGLNKTEYSLNIGTYLGSVSYGKEGNGTAVSDSSPSLSSFKTIRRSIMTLGICGGVLYLLLMVFQYFKFIFEYRLKIKQYIELQNNCAPDNDFIKIIHEYNDAQVYMITKMELKMITNNKKDALSDKLFWFNDYLFGSTSNLTNLGIMIISLSILLLSITANWSPTTTNTVSLTSNSTVTSNKEYSIGLNVSSNSNSQLSSNFETILDSQAQLSLNTTRNLTIYLDEIFSKYDLNLTAPMMYISLYNSTSLMKNSTQSQINSIISYLENITVEESIVVDSMSFSPNELASNLAKIIYSVFYSVIKLLVIILTSIFSIIVLFGCVYSFLV